MTWLALAVFAFFLPTLAVFAVIGAWRASRRLSEARYPPPPGPPLERLEADLRRLRAELEDTESRSDLTAKNHRVKALRGAYVDALADACRRLDVSPVAGGYYAPLPEIYRVEAALRQRGLDVRETAAH
ncbi:MAG TPA: hypothetical protein VHY31_19025 [Streptosporangiaceae bacterium]|nr:hypothetical protein [Streptosporangiaceae bacterium]